MSEAVKQSVLNIIAEGSPITPEGRAKYFIKNKIVHVRFCSEN
jgi:hypothetical protein